MPNCPISVATGSLAVLGRQVSRCDVVDLRLNGPDRRLCFRLILSQPLGAGSEIRQVLDQISGACSILAADASTAAAFTEPPVSDMGRSAVGNQISAIEMRVMALTETCQ